MTSRLALLLLLLPLSVLAAQSLQGNAAQARLLYDQKNYAEAAAVLEKWKAAARQDGGGEGHPCQGVPSFLASRPIGERQ